MTHEKNQNMIRRLCDGDLTARDELVRLNMEWVDCLVSGMVVNADIQKSEIHAAAKVGLFDAIDKFGNKEHQFAPNEDLEGGYAIWWVRLRISQLAFGRGFTYSPVTNRIDPDIQSE